MKEKGFTLAAISLPIFYQSVGEVPQTMGGAGGAFENALERLLANSETNIEKVMDGEQ